MRIRFTIDTPYEHASDEFLRFTAQRRKSTTLISYASWDSNYLRPQFAGLPLGSLSAGDFEDVIAPIALRKPQTACQVITIAKAVMTLDVVAAR